MGIIIWAILGLIAGTIAKAIYPGEQKTGVLGTILLGILGAQLGGWVGRELFDTRTADLRNLTFAEVIPSLLMAILGAIAIIFIWGLLTKPSR
ncbi:GlsB/YeaQ/YmgE family stress response membrane protein [Euhalothece natronophila Z-M001]|uniref:GlsB/YeaQ/YmgE family stress response membrane protein n=1 Tax=Euhalothece natronophila Z-M001 TaxID=522448 RepID=A0A5B8NLP0_9CHRO|nr:GlsB/YeaQ/YmgE family stress response membrane protein [Euhalothece natronophila]QDZ39451.1 GlsB/YeaQ/YmgE family stress response membrane protein [Euhalothece natronophila Z-M001]